MESYRKAIGRPTSTIFGLQALGLFGKDIPLEGHSLQSYGHYHLQSHCCLSQRMQYRRFDIYRMIVMSD